MNHFTELSSQVDLYYINMLNNNVTSHSYTHTTQVTTGSAALQSVSVGILHTVVLACLERHTASPICRTELICLVCTVMYSLGGKGLLFTRPV